MATLEAADKTMKQVVTRSARGPMAGTIGGARRLWGRRRPRLGLALGGGGVIGGMYEVGFLAALEETVIGPGHGRPVDIYVGCSAGSLVASVLANGVSAAELYRILSEDLDDPLNFRRTSVYAADAIRRALFLFARFIWAVGKNAATGPRSSLPDMLVRAERDFPAGFFSLATLEQYVRAAFDERGLANAFADLPRLLLIPAIDLNRAERVVFGRPPFDGVPVSQAIAASSAIPGFFEPFTVDGRDYIDGGVGFTSHADLAVEAGSDVVIVVHPLVPAFAEEGPRSLRERGLYFILEQSNRIYSQRLFDHALAELAGRWPDVKVFFIQPSPTGTSLFGPSMGFDAARDALHYGYASGKEWVGAHGEELARVLEPGGAWRRLRAWARSSGP